MKDILVAFDGTGCAWEDRTNVARVIEATREAGATAAYFDGVGTRWYNTVRGNLLGVGSFKRLAAALLTACRAWQPGDRLWSVGFSRGGAAAIGFANLVDAVGVGPGLASEEAVAEAVRVWQSRPSYLVNRSARFRADHGTERPGLHFVGAFDPVGALGAAIPRVFARMKFAGFDQDLAPRLRHYFALLAVDERRAKFLPVLQDREARESTAQVWTPGCHGDVGGSHRQPLAGYALGLMLEAMRDAGLAGLPYGVLSPRPYREALATTSGRGLAGRVMGRLGRRPGLGHVGERRSRLASAWLEDGRAPDTPPWVGVRELLEYVPGIVSPREDQL